MSRGIPSNGRTLRRADPSTIQDKLMVGYQGWFFCAGDGEPVGPGHHGWLHWFNCPIPDGGRPNIDLWPDVSEYTSSELFPAPGLKSKQGDQLHLFSSRHSMTVQRHFNWMAQHGVDGAFLQRFACQCDIEGGHGGARRLRDEVGDRVREAAEKEGRVFALMYDVSGVPPDKIQRILEQDWIHLIREKRVLESPSYLREKGKPVVSLWGFGFETSHHHPELVRAITNFFRSSTPGGAYLIGGAPAFWRSSSRDADPNPQFLSIWLNDFDAISPWTIGRYGNEDEADRFAEHTIKGDVDLLKKRAEEGMKRVDYIPVIFPGGSGYNLSGGKWGFNDIKRNGGRFFWKQIFNVRRLGVRTMYGAMWDEYDEGTALMPVVEKKRQLPDSDKFPFMALDEDGFDLPSDWYMRICGFAAEGLRSERRIFDSFPSKELQDYWATRPRFEEPVQQSSVASSSSATGISQGSGTNVGGSSGGEQSYDDWLASQKEEKEEAPPPPYSLEEGLIPASVSANATNLNATSTPNTPSSNQIAASNVQVLPELHLSPATNEGIPSGGRNAITASPQPFSSELPSMHPTGLQRTASLGRNSESRDPQSPPTSGSTQPVRSSSVQAMMVSPPLHPSHPQAQSRPTLPSTNSSSPGAEPGQRLSGPSQAYRYNDQSSGGANLTGSSSFIATSNRPGRLSSRPSTSPQVSNQTQPSRPQPGLEQPPQQYPKPQYGNIQSHLIGPFNRNPGPQHTPTAGLHLPAAQFNSTYPGGPSPNSHPNASFTSSYPGFPQSQHPPQGPYTNSSYPSVSPFGADSRLPQPIGPSYNSGQGFHQPGGLIYGPSFPSGPPIPPHPSAQSSFGSSFEPHYPGPATGEISPWFPPGPVDGISVTNHPPLPQHQPYSNFGEGFHQPYNQGSGSDYSTQSAFGRPLMTPSFPPQPNNQTRPNQGGYSPYPQPSEAGGGFPTPTPSASSGPLGFALEAVDRLAGQDTRRQIERQVDSLAQTGSKLFGRLSK